MSALSRLAFMTELGAIDEGIDAYLLWSIGGGVYSKDE
jgi:hypothetical protein